MSWGDLQTFMTEMETILNKSFTSGYSESPVQYLSDWETAAIKLQRVTPNEDWSDSAKRRKFSHRFSVLGWTDMICDTALDTTTTWDDFADSLRKKLVRRKYMEENNRASSVNNINLLDLDNNYSYSTPSSTYNSDSFSTPIVNNVEIDQNNLPTVIMHTLSITLIL